MLNTDLENALQLVEVDPSQFEAALLNVIVNARDAMPEGGTITIRTHNVTGEQIGGREGAIAVSIEDNGSGSSRTSSRMCSNPFSRPRRWARGLAWD